MGIAHEIALVAFLIAGAAEAVQSEESNLTWREKPLAVPLAVSWDLTRSDGGKEAVATHTEHYRETWFFEVRPGLVTYLRTPRGRVPVTGVSYEGREIPRRIVLPEADFAKLLGIPSLPFEEDKSIAPLVTMDLSIEQAPGEDYSLPVSEQDYALVHLDVTL